MLEKDDPELIVMLIGGWEDQRAYEVPGILGSEICAELSRTSARPVHRACHLDGRTAAVGGVPAGRKSQGHRDTHQDEPRFEQVAADHPDVVYIDSSPFLLGGGDGTEYTESINGADGPIRLRSNDSHLCPEAVVRLAEPLLAMIEGAWAIDVDDGGLPATGNKLICSRIRRPATSEATLDDASNVL